MLFILIIKTHFISHDVIIRRVLLQLANCVGLIEVQYKESKEVRHFIRHFWNIALQKRVVSVLSLRIAAYRTWYGRQAFDGSPLLKKRFNQLAYDLILKKEYFSSIDHENNLNPTVFSAQMHSGSNSHSDDRFIHSVKTTSSIGIGTFA